MTDEKIYTGYGKKEELDPADILQPGTRVRVIEYGSIAWRGKRDFPVKPEVFKLLQETKDAWIIDTHPELVGQEGIIDYYKVTQQVIQYAVNGLPIHAWYDHPQLEVI